MEILEVLVINVFIIVYLLFAWGWNGGDGSVLKKLLWRCKGPYVWLGLWHGWAMFAPDPLRLNRQLVAEIHLADGGMRVWTFEGLDGMNFWRAFLKMRDRKFEANLFEGEFAFLTRPALAEWLVRHFTGLGENVAKVVLVCEQWLIPNPYGATPPADPELVRKVIYTQAVGKVEDRGSRIDDRGSRGTVARRVRRSAVSETFGPLTPGPSPPSGRGETIHSHLSILILRPLTLGTPPSTLHPPPSTLSPHHSQMLTWPEVAAAWNGFFHTPEPSTSLALFRIAFGLLLVVNAGLLVKDLPRYFGPLGLVSAERIAWAYGKTRLTLFNLLPSTLGSVYFVLALHVLAAVCLAVGFGTRVSAVVAFVTLVSLHHRNPCVLHSGDSLHRLLLFLLIFSHAGNALSVDAWLVRGSSRTHSQVRQWTRGVNG